MDDRFRELSRVLKALADENRLRLLALVHEGELACACGEDGCDETRCMTDLVEMLGVSQATVSHHVKELVDAGLIVTRKRGRWVHCQVNREGLGRLCEFLAELTRSQLPCCSGTAGMAMRQDMNPQGGIEQ